MILSIENIYELAVFLNKNNEKDLAKIMLNFYTDLIKDFSDVNTKSKMLNFDYLSKPIIEKYMKKIDKKDILVLKDKLDKYAEKCFQDVNIMK